MKTPHALGLCLLAVLATLAVEEFRIARLRAESPAAELAGKSGRGGAASDTSPGGAAGDKAEAMAPAKSRREAGNTNSPGAGKEKEDEESFSKTVRKMWDNPAGKAMMNQGVKIAVAMMYEEFIEGLNLTKEESDYIKTLLGKEMTDQQELGMKLLSATPEEQKKLTEEMSKRAKENEEAIKTFLNNEEDFQSFTDYKNRLPERQQLEGIRAVLDSKGAPLNADAEARLVEAMYLARTQADAPDYSGPHAFEEMAKGNIIENFEAGWQEQDDQLMAATQGILNEAQQAAFKEYREEAKKMQLMGIKMAEKMMSEKEEGK